MHVFSKLCELLVPPAHADLADMMAVGVDLAPVENYKSPVRLEREELEIEVFAEIVKVKARFFFHNDGDTETLKVGFPIVFTNSFSALDMGLFNFEAQVQGQKVEGIKRMEGPAPIRDWCQWEQEFPGHAPLLIEVSYQVFPFSYRDWSLRTFNYVLRTGRFWKGKKIGHLSVKVKFSPWAELLLEDIGPPGYDWDLETRTFSWEFENWLPDRDIELLLHPLPPVPIGFTIWRDSTNATPMTNKKAPLQPPSGERVTIHGTGGLDGNRRGDMTDFRKFDSNILRYSYLPYEEHHFGSINLEFAEGAAPEECVIPLPIVGDPAPYGSPYVRIEGTTQSDKVLVDKVYRLVHQMPLVFDGLSSEAELKTIYDQILDQRKRLDDFKLSNKAKVLERNHTPLTQTPSLSREIQSQREAHLLEKLSSPDCDSNTVQELFSFYQLTLQLDKFGNSKNQVFEKISSETLRTEAQFLWATFDPAQWEVKALDSDSPALYNEDKASDFLETPQRGLLQKAMIKLYIILLFLTLLGMVGFLIYHPTLTQGLITGGIILLFAISIDQLDWES